MSRIRLPRYDWVTENNTAKFDLNANEDKKQIFDLKVRRKCAFQCGLISEHPRWRLFADDALTADLYKLT